MRIVTFLCAMFLSITFLSAQDEKDDASTQNEKDDVSTQKKKDDKPALVKIESGWTSGTLSNTDSDNLSGFYVGVRKEMKLIPLLRFESGLVFYQAGASNVTIGTDPYNEFRLNYLQVPLGLKLKLGPLYALGGMGMNFRLSAKADGSKYSKDLNIFDAPWYAGVGLKVLIFAVEARYYGGLIDVSDKSESAGMRSNYFSLGLGLSLGKR